ncbi:hypothetical protein LY76DRAFT_577099 [Colletotrichum caudatum]|nr:hypothetical protein LY76DRAFT_577099 [Colletotrichum caudatum]
MLFGDSFMRLPPTTAVLLLGSIFTLTEAGALPPQTQAQIPLRTLDVRSWPLATPAPWLGMMRRQDDSTNTVCGYIGADPNLPATCSAGSHCAMDASASAVGCCPNGVACSTGIYTSCVDSSSPTQTVSDPYIFTCQGSNVCYRNTYDGGAYQYGCGSTSQGATVFETASGLSTTVAITRISVITRQETSSSSSSSTSSSSSSTSSSTTSTSTSSSSSTTSSFSTTSTTQSSTTASASATEAQASPSGSAGPPPGAVEAGLRRHGATIGGAIAGAAVFVAIVSVAVWLSKRNRRRNQRLGPGAGKCPSYVPEPITKDFAPVPGGEMMFDQAGYGHPAMMPGAHGTTTSISGGNAAGTPPRAGPGGYNPAHGAVPHTAGESVPLTQSNEADEFARGYHDAAFPAREDYRATSLGSTIGGNPYGAGAGEADIAEQHQQQQHQADGVDGKPLWQQTRRQSRNMVWR